MAHLPGHRATPPSWTSPSGWPTTSTPVRCGPGSRPGYPGHPEVELALVKLGGVTGERRYMELARFFIEHRGSHFFAQEHQDAAGPL